MSRDRAEKKPPKILIIDDEEWPELDADAVQVILVKVETPNTRDRTAMGLSILFGLLFAVYIGHAMWTGSLETQTKGFELVRVGLAASGLWAFRRFSTLAPHEPNTQSQESPSHR